MRFGSPSLQQPYQPSSGKSMPSWQTDSLFQPSGLMGPQRQTSNNTGAQRWLLPYADLVTLLLVLFVAMAMMGLKPAVAKSARKQNGVSSQSNAVNPTFENTNASVPALVSEQGQKIQKILAQSKTPVAITEDDRGVILSFEEKIFFAPGSASIQPQANATLHRLADALNNTPGNIRVEGHTDNTPIQTSQYPSNWELSTHRATAILRYLIQQEKLSPKRLSAAGYGEYQPKVENTTETNRQKNRRVDIVLLPVEPQIDLPKESKLTKKTVESKLLKNTSDDQTLAIISEEIQVPKTTQAKKLISNKE